MARLDWAILGLLIALAFAGTYAGRRLVLLVRAALFRRLVAGALILAGAALLAGSLFT